MFFARIFFCFMVPVFLLAGCDSRTTPVGQPVTEAAAYEGIIVAVGDSLTEGYGLDEADAWPARMQEKLRQTGYGFQVINAGISGETSSGTLSRLEWILTLKPDIVVLETGANDGLRGIDPELTRRNIEQIVIKLRESGVIVVLAGMDMVRNMGAEYITAFRRIYPEIAKKYNLILVPFFLEGVAGNTRLNQADGIHPAAEGYAVITETVYPHVLRAIEEFRKPKKSGP